MNSRDYIAIVTINANRSYLSLCGAALAIRRGWPTKAFVCARVVSGERGAAITASCQNLSDAPFTFAKMQVVSPS
jgi:hypothetical protein